MHRQQPCGSWHETALSAFSHYQALVVRSTQWDTEVSYADLTSNYIPGYLVYPLNKPVWETVAISKEEDTQSNSLRWSRNSNFLRTSKPGLKILYCTEWKQAYEVDLPTELLQWQSNWWLMSQFFHSDGEWICSLRMDPKWQWLTRQGVRGDTLIPVGRAAMLTPLPSLSHGGTHPPLTKPCSLLPDHDAMAMSPLFYDPETTHAHTHSKSITVLWF